MTIHAQSQIHYHKNLGFPLYNNSQGLCAMVNACEFIEPFFSTVPLKQEMQSFHQQQQNHSLFNQQLMNQHVMQHGQSYFVPTPGNNIANNKSDQLPVAYSSSFAAQMDTQRHQLDNYVKLQNERLVLLLQEQRKQQVGLLMKKLESKTIILLRQKDAEIAKAAQSQMELEGFLMKLEMERQEWQKIAQENEAMAESLNKTLEELRKACRSSNNVVEDAESCCDVNMIGDTDETGESRRLVLVDDDHHGPPRTTRKVMVCRGCNSRESCMLFLPCRHLCACKNCEAFLGCCPVCGTIKEASIDALI